MIPPFDSNGFLPPGVHECSFIEIRERFGGPGYGLGRHDLVTRLEHYLDEVRATNLVEYVVVDGSFVTAKPDPGDVDLILVLFRDHDFSRELRPFEENPLSRRWVSKNFHFDVLVAADGSVELTEYLGFFARVRGSMVLTKGVLRVKA